MAVCITVEQVRDFCPEAENVSDSVIDLFIAQADRADQCLDSGQVEDPVQTFLKLSAVCHLLARQTGNLGVKSETDMDGASVSFESYKIDGYGLASTTFGQNILSSDVTCFEYLDRQQHRFMRSFGRNRQRGLR
jgi:hypothetical protein